MPSGPLLSVRKGVFCLTDTIEIRKKNRKKKWDPVEENKPHICIVKNCRNGTLSVSDVTDERVRWLPKHSLEKNDLK